MRKCTLRTRLVLQSCDFRAGAAEVYFAYWTCTTKLRFSSWSCGSVLLVLDLYYKVAILELEMRKCTSRIRLALQSCDFRAGSAKVRKHCKTIRSPPKTITCKKVLGPSKVFRPLLIYIRRIYSIVYIYIHTWYPPQYPGVVASCIKTIDIYSVFFLNSCIFCKAILWTKKPTKQKTKKPKKH